MIQVQIQALIIEEVVEEVERVGEESNTKFNIEMAKPLIFNRDTSRVGEFIIAYRLYLRMKMRETIVEKQIL